MLKLVEIWGVNPNLLSRWKRDVEGNSGGDLSPASVVSIQSELKCIRKENKRLRMEREILKKAAAWKQYADDVGVVEILGAISR